MLRNIADELAVRVGLGLRCVGRTISTAETSKLTTPGYVLADALVALDWQSWTLAINAVNLTDKRYYTVCRTFGDCFTGNRRTVVATLTRRF